MRIAMIEAVWIRHLLAEFGITENAPIKVFFDSKATIQIVKNMMFQEKNKTLRVGLSFHTWKNSTRNHHNSVYSIQGTNC